MSTPSALPTQDAGPPPGAQLTFAQSGGVAYESQLSSNPEWALREGSRHFEEKSAVFEALRKITARLQEIGIDYAIAGGMALFQHGFRRFTEDVDLLVGKQDLKMIYFTLTGEGYTTPQSRQLRDPEVGVRLRFLATGDYPGDGKPKPVAYPHPREASVEMQGMRFLSLRDLIELKLASGISSPQRAKDLVDVQELISILGLKPEFANQLHPSVQGKFRELVAIGTRRYVLLWRNKQLIESAAVLDSMLQDGVVLESAAGVSDDYAYLVTTDPAVAKKYDMLDEAELWQEEEGLDESGPAD